MPPADAPDAEFSALFRSMHTELRRFAVRRLDVDLVDDVVAETFLAVWDGWATVPTDPSGQRAWVYGIARNKMRQAGQNAARGARLANRVASVRPGSPDDLETTLTALEGARALLDRLPDAEREAVQLTVLGGLSCAEAAEVLGCSLSAVTSRVARGRNRLRRLLDDDTGGGTDDQ